MLEFCLIKVGSDEWNWMWTWLENHPINKGIENPSIAIHENEAWMYMGSYMNNKNIVHTFTHRNHPLTKQRVNTSVKGSVNLTEDQIQKKLKI